MARRAAWLVLVAAICAVLVVGWLVWQRSVAAPDRVDGRPTDFSSPSAQFETPELAVELRDVRGTVHPDYTDWSCVLVCREPDGCHADILVSISYLSGGSLHTLTVGGRVDAANGEPMGIGRTQRPPRPVDSIERVSLEVVNTFRPGDPTPTPME